MSANDDQFEKTVDAHGSCAPSAGSANFGYNPEHAIGTCAKCGAEMVHNVPRLGPSGGFVHKSTGRFECGNSPNRPGSATGPTTQSVTMPNDSKTDSAQPGSLHPAGSEARLVKIQMQWPNFSLEYVATYERAKRLMPIVLKEAMEAEEECQAIRKQMPPNEKGQR